MYSLNEIKNAATECKELLVQVQTVEDVILDDEGENDIFEYGSEIDFTEFSLDDISDYIVDGPMVNVMLSPSDELLDRIEKFLGGNIEYMDFYGFIDSRVNLVTKIEAVITAGDDKRYYTFNIPAESQAWMFMNILDKDHDGITEALEEAKTENHQKLLDDTVSIIEYFEEFLEERGIKVPTSEALKKEAGDDEDNDAVIYGEDYAELEDNVMAYLSNENDLKKQWWDAYYAYGSDPANGFDELDFVTEAIERDINDAWIRMTYSNKVLAEWFRNFASEHGLI